MVSTPSTSGVDEALDQLDDDPIQLSSFRRLAEFKTGVDILLRNNLSTVPSRKEEIEERRVLDQLGDIVSSSLCGAHFETERALAMDSSMNTKSNPTFSILTSRRCSPRLYSFSGTTCEHWHHVSRAFDSIDWLV
jgi:hypothetical protein